MAPQLMRFIKKRLIIPEIWFSVVTFLTDYSEITVTILKAGMDQVYKALYGYEALLFISPALGLLGGYFFGRSGMIIGLVLPLLAFDWEKAAKRRRAAGLDKK